MRVRMRVRQDLRLCDGRYSRGSEQGGKNDTGKTSSHAAQINRQSAACKGAVVKPM
jgi:hypothetical protein